MKGAGSVKFGRVACVCLLGLVAFRVSEGQERQNPAKSSKSESGKAAIQPTALFREDWTTLTLENSSFLMKHLELAAKDDIPNTGFIRERYEVLWRPNDPFDLYVIRPRGTARPPVILYLYSFPEDTDQFKNNSWCESAVSGGYAAIGFIGAVTGHRTRYRLPKEWFVSEMPEALASTTHDVQLILDYLATRGDLDTGRVGMFGVGSGGSIAILASAVDARIRAVDLLGPWGDWPGWVAHSQIVAKEERNDFLKSEFLDKVAPLDPVLWLPKMKAKIVRIQDIRKNTSIPDESQKKLEAAAPDFALINEYGNGRAFLSAQPPALTFQWLKDQLQPDAKFQVSADKSERVHLYPAVEAPAQNWPNVGKLEVDKPETAAKQKDKREKDHN